MGKGKGRGRGNVCCCESELCCTFIVVFLLVYGGLLIVASFFKFDGKTIVRAEGFEIAGKFVAGLILVGMGILLLVGKIMRSVSLLRIWVILLLIFIICNILLLFLILWHSKEKFSTAVANESTWISNILFCCFFEYCVYQFKSEL